LYVRKYFALGTAAVCPALITHAEAAATWCSASGTRLLPMVTTVTSLRGTPTLKRNASSR
jgi:hypothetical protein